MLLSGCVQTQTRECLSFDHPILLELSGANDRGKIYFTSEDGKTLSFGNSSGWFKKRHTVRGGKNVNLVCHGFTQATFQIQEEPAWVRYQLSHWDLPELDFDDETLKAEFFIGRTGNNKALRNFSHTFNATDQTNSTVVKLSEQPEQTTEKVPALSIDGKTISDAIKMSLTSPDKNDDSDALYSLGTIFLSKQFGLVRLVLDSGTTYDRKWPTY